MVKWSHHNFGPDLPAKKAPLSQLRGLFYCYPFDIADISGMMRQNKNHPAIIVGGFGFSSMTMTPGFGTGSFVVYGVDNLDPLSVGNEPLLCYYWQSPWETGAFVYGTLDIADDIV
jgi:hypothetical protein